MPTQAVLFNIQRRLGTAADRCQQSREERDQLGPIDPEGPSVGAIFVSIIGILTIPAAVLADYHLLAAPVAYICQLSGAAETTAARILVPVALTLINVAASINRAQQTVLDGTYSEYEPQTGPRNPIIAIILLLQVAAAVAQYIALQAVNPAPANAVILLLLGAMAVVTHMAVYLMAGNGILLLAKDPATNHYARPDTAASPTRSAPSDEHSSDTTKYGTPHSTTTDRPTPAHPRRNWTP
jgi:hypothetical protein